MRISWGNKLLIVLIVFVGGMSFLVLQCLHTDYELVSSDYYKQELEYQQVIDASRLANALGSDTRVQYAQGLVQIQLPDEMKDQAVSGTAYFYCPTAAGNDRRIKLNPDKNGRQVIDGHDLKAASYIVKLSWSAGDKQYYSEKNLIVSR